MKQETVENLARISLVSVFAAFLCGCCLNAGLVNPTIQSPGRQELDATTKLLIGLIPIVIAAGGLGCGVTALVTAIRDSKKNVVPMAIAGIILNVGYLAFVAYTIILIRNLAAE